MLVVALNMLSVTIFVYTKNGKGAFKVFDSKLYEFKVKKTVNPISLGHSKVLAQNLFLMYGMERGSDHVHAFNPIFQFQTIPLV